MYIVFSLLEEDHNSVHKCIGNSGSDPGNAGKGCTHVKCAENFKNIAQIIDHSPRLAVCTLMRCHDR